MPFGISDSKLKVALLMINAVAILFTSQILIKYLFAVKNGNLKLICFTFILLIFYMIYYIFIYDKSILSENIEVTIKIVLQLIIFTLVVIISGGDQSVYKALFIFCIITASLKKGMKVGILVSVISSFCIFIIDLSFMHNHLIILDLESDLILSALFISIAWIIGYCINMSAEYINKLQNLACKDSLTDLYNHGYFYTKLIEISNKCKLNSEKLSLIFLDIDDFKYYNDLNGHQQGDHALKQLADILKANVRPNDIVCRYGGEEFTIILPNTNEKQAVILAEKIRSTVEITKFKNQENQPSGNFTVSIGVSTYPDKVKNELDLIKSADDALYKVKFFHKNRVETYTSILDGIKDIVEDGDKKTVESIKTLINVINAKDKYTYSHVERVVMYTKLLANKLNLNNKDKLTLIRGSYLHDIGKINISKEILIKTTPLTDEEWIQLKRHPKYGVEILKDIDALKNIIPMVLYHHERYDGKGYPEGLKGEDIPYLARVLNVVDSFDAMTSARVFSVRKSFDEGKEELLKCSGTQFDPEVVKTFIEVINEIK